MKPDLSNKVVLITGVCNGIGKSIVEKFAASGANVGMMGQDMQNLVQIEKEINGRSAGKVFAIQGDMSNSDELMLAVWQTVEVFGSLNLLLNSTDIVEESQNYILILKELNL